MPVQRLFHFDGRDILATRDDNIFRAVLELNVAIGMNDTQVTRVEPPPGHGLLRSLCIAVIAFHDHIAAKHDLAHGFTIARHGLNIVIVVLNDGAYGSEIHKLRAEGLSDDGAVFGRTDLAAIARGFGIGGHTITDLTALPDLIADHARTGGAAVWDVPISDKVYSPVIARAHPPKGH